MPEQVIQREDAGVLIPGLCEGIRERHGYAILAAETGDMEPIRIPRRNARGAASRRGLACFENGKLV